MEPIADFPTLQALFGRYDIIRHIQELAKESQRLGVLVEFNSNIRSPEFGTVLGVRRPVPG